MARHKFKNESGYSLVEVLAAIVILTVAIIPMVTMFDTGLRSATTSGNYDTARALANTQLETIKGMDYEAATGAYPPGDSPRDCEPGTFDPATFGCEVATDYVSADIPEGSDTASFESPGGETDMMRIAVTVEWGNGNEYSATGLTAR